MLRNVTFSGKKYIPELCKKHESCILSSFNLSGEKSWKKQKRLYNSDELGYGLLAINKYKKKKEKKERKKKRMRWRKVLVKFNKKRRLFFPTNLLMHKSVFLKCSKGESNKKIHAQMIFYLI